MYNKQHLINKNEFTWKTLPSGLKGLFENDTYTGFTKCESGYREDEIEYYTSDKRDFNTNQCSLEDYAIALGLNVHNFKSGRSTSTQSWYTYILK